jgi:hypothetical protein
MADQLIPPGRRCLSMSVVAACGSKDSSRSVDHGDAYDQFGPRGREAFGMWWNTNPIW